jgi:hypothetical protein
MPINCTSLTRFRKISEEASREERYRGCVEEVGYTYNRRGPDGDRGNLEGYEQGGRQSDGAY